MQQIETEKALVPKKKVNTRPVIKNMLTTFGVMYALIAIVGMAVYSTSGQSGLSSATFLVPVVLISSVCSMFWMISVYDDRRRSKHKAK
jgi:multisubunit Na+/H+ antiporter MnhG subunit